MLFTVFVGYCTCSKISLKGEYLVRNNVSVNMVANHVSAIKTKFIMYDLDYAILDHPKVWYVSLKINRPLSIVKTNVMSLQVLKSLVDECNYIFKAIFLWPFSGS